MHVMDMYIQTPYHHNNKAVNLAMWFTERVLIQTGRGERLVTFAEKVVDFHCLALAVPIRLQNQTKCTCSMQSRDCVVHSQNPEIVHYSCTISRLRSTLVRSRDGATIVCNLLPSAHVQKPSRGFKRSY